MLEKDVRRKVLKKLKENGWFVMSLSEKLASGYPDLLCIKDGQYVFIELKRPKKGKLSLIQIAFHNKLKALGCKVLVINDVKQLEGIL